MPAKRHSLSMDAIDIHCARAFAEADDDLFGMELEWPTQLPQNRDRPSLASLRTLDGVILPAGGRISIEPGGQLELSTHPAPNVRTAIEYTRHDAEELRRRAAAANIRLIDTAVDATRPPRRMLTKDRYRAMEAFFAARGREGIWMMTNTAATQFNVSHAPGDLERRWRDLHRIGPVLLAAFARSPGTDLKGRRWASLRQSMWWSIDPGRSAPVAHAGSPAQAWRDYACRADVMFIAKAAGGTHGVAVAPGLSFERWMAQGHPCGWPTIEDFAYHLTTLFPPIRPKGWLELRFLDALPAPIRENAALAVAVIGDAAVSPRIRERVPDCSGLWVAAAREGLRDPRLHSAARELFRIVNDSIRVVTDDHAQIARFDDFVGRYVRAGRMPGDDLSLADLRTCDGARRGSESLPQSVPAGA